MTAPDCIAYIEYVSGAALRYPRFGCPGYNLQFSHRVMLSYNHGAC